MVEDTDGPLIYTIDRTAQKLDASRAVVYRLIRAGRLQTVSFNSRKYVTAAELDRFVGTLVAEGAA